MAERKTSLQNLLDHGQSYWLDNLTRGKIRGGEIERRVSMEGLRGITSNPAIFHKAISGGEEYADQIDELARRGLGPYEIYEQLVLTDIRDACDILRPVFEASDGSDGFVSLELSPYLAHDTASSMRDARRLFGAVDRPNLLIKIPGTPAGTPAIEQMLYEGVNVNITLLFSIEAYESVAHAYLRALERRLEEGKSVHDVASVASFFISRIDVLVDQILGHHLRPGAEPPDELAPERLLGKAGIANAKLAYQSFLGIVEGDRWRRLEAAGARPQRMLWASTSTKDPLYSDVMYVEPLIGPYTVNTLPDQTITAFVDHGIVADTVTEGVDEARRTMEELARVGVDFDAVTWQLMNEGVQKFIDPFDRLLATIGSERSRSLRGAGENQELSLGAERGGVDAALGALATRQFGRRLFAGDASLWTSEAEKAAEVRNRLGWLTAPSDFLERTAEIVAFAEKVRDAGFQDVVLLGMGGSSLAADVGRATFGSADGWPALTVLDDTDPAAVRAVRDATDARRTLFLVSSKSGTTTETLSLFRTFYGWAEDELGLEAGASFAAITDPGSPLAEEARECGFRRLFENPADFGGRYSALSYFGLVPMALQGVDISTLLERSGRMRAGCGPEVPPGANPGIELGAALARLAERGRDKVTFASSDAVSAFGAWAEQLLAESTGKDGKGLIPIDGEPLGEPGVYGDDRVFVHLRTSAEEDASRAGKLRALEAAGHPLVRLVVHDALGLGAEFYRWELATATAGAILGIDAFDQPDVEAAKQRTRELLAEWEESGAFDEGTPIAEDEHLALFAEDAPEDGGPGGRLGAFLSAAEPGDYLGLLAYVHRTPDRQERLAGVREALRDRLGLATTLGYGPRYLHSTGQLHKGGPDTGRFVIITADESEDIPIPGQPFGFATLHRAQSLGDLRALRDAGRQVVRLHLRGDVEQALGHLADLLEVALSSRAVKA
jgi:transaldolase/glucose-6-phosphate isomerase